MRMIVPLLDDLAPSRQWPHGARRSDAIDPPDASRRLEAWRRQHAPVLAEILDDDLIIDVGQTNAVTSPGFAWTSDT